MAWSGGPGGLLLALVLCWSMAGIAGAQPPATSLQHPHEGKTIESIEVLGARNPGTILRQLKMKAGRPLRAADVRDDLQNLWALLKVKAAVSTEETPDGRVRVFLEVQEFRAYDRIEFRGLRHYKEREVRSILGIPLARRMTELEASTHTRTLEARYRRDGFYFVRVELRKDPERSVLTFQIDEGPQVTVRRVHFRGNRAFPGEAFLGLWTNLAGDAELQSDPAGWFTSGAPYSDEAVEEDLTNLRIFYRSRGYRDARVELAAREFTPDRSEVDLTFRVIEGRRYKIGSVHVEYEDPDREKPLYDEDRILEIVQVKPGDYYDRDEINRDMRAIERFYGERGHPPQGRFGRRQIPGAFLVREPRETYDMEAGLVHLTYRIVEGSPKTLRDVRIQGNSDTLDAVIRRKVFLLPGDRLDISEVERSLSALDSLRYFQTPERVSGVSFELLPVEDAPDQVDLQVNVTEGDTGSLLWGAGISTGAGIIGRIQFTKRNFDLFRLPSSWNPVTIVREIIENKAFHGAGQELELFLAPGTEISMFRLSFHEPDLFGDHFDTIGLRVQGYRQLRVLDSFDTDSLGMVVGFQRNFTERFSTGLFVRQETVQVEDIDANAPGLVWDAQGSTELRGIGVNMRWRDLDHFLRPTEGHDVDFSAEVVGGPFGADASFWKVGAGYRYYYPLYRDSFDRAHVLYVRQRFDFGQGFDESKDLFLTERFYMGGSNLRGFDQRSAGPTQFGRPLGGEARFLTTVEYQFPIVSTRMESRFRETELLRGVVFADFGMLGTRIDDATFTEPRLSLGVGVRLLVPVLGLPIALDLGFPVVFEQTDERRPLFFSLGRF